MGRLKTENQAALKQEVIQFRVNQRQYEFIQSRAKEMKKGVNDAARTIIDESKWHDSFDKKLRDLDMRQNELEVFLRNENALLRKELARVMSPIFIADLIKELFIEMEDRQTQKSQV